MKISRLVSAASLSLLLGCSALMYAQDEHETKPQEPRPEETKPPQSEAAKPAQDEAKPPRQEEAKPPRQDEKPQDNMKPKQDDMRPRPQDDAKAPKQENRQDNRAQQNHDQHAATQQRGHIPDDKFRSNFGHEHRFKVSRGTVVEGRPSFQYGGYSFEIVDAWPADWSYSDDCYVDYVDGEYFLFDILHPGVRIAIIVVM